jgi:hypothetical protein
MSDTKTEAESKTKFWNCWSSKNIKVTRNIAMYSMKMTRLAFLMLSLPLLFFGLVSAEPKSETWTPEPKFSIENSSYTETLIFISGVSYALTSANAELKRSAKQNFFCLKDTDTVGSKLLIDIINKKHSGSITSEQAIETIIQGLKKRYPCKNR